MSCHFYCLIFLCTFLNRQCAFTLGQLCESKSVLGILQNHCQDSLWHRVPRDAPSYVDLGAYMFQSDIFRLSGNGNLRSVATTVSYSCVNRKVCLESSSITAKIHSGTEYQEMPLHMLTSVPICFSRTSLGSLVMAT